MMAACARRLGRVALRLRLRLPASARTGNGGIRLLSKDVGSGQKTGSAPGQHPYYSDEYINSVLSEMETIAMVGASTKWNRPSYFAMKYLQEKGYRVIPVNPRAAGETILGEKVFPSLSEIPQDIKIDMVDVFQRADRCPPIAKEAVERKASILWLQLGIISEEAEKIATAGGLKVVMNRCPKIEFSRLHGELSMHGFSSNVISSRRRTIGGSKSEYDDKKDENEAELAEFTSHSVGFDTLSIHAGATPDPTTGARATPIFQTTSYVFEDVDQAASLFNLQTFGNIYSRLSNPTVSVLEERIASLDKGRGATCCSSGHSAQMIALFPLMQPGDSLVSSNKLYGGSITQFGKSFQKFGWDCTFVDTDDLDQVRKAVKDSKNVKALFAESLANPGGSVTDIAGLKEIAEEEGIPLIIDNTLATPYLCRPIHHGADLVVYSTTKFLSGHGNAMGGAVVDSGTFDWAKNDKFPSLSQPEPAYHGLTFQETFGDLAYTTFAHAVSLRDLGPTMAPVNAYLTITGIETLSLRMSRHCENAQMVAEFLDSHPEVEWVSYAGLPSSKYHKLAQKYLPRGAGAVFTFGLKGGFEKGISVVERCQLFSHLANVGDTRSLVLHPASTTHRQLTAEQREAAGAGDNVIRLSIGLESPEDLIRDIKSALA
mmetsp:Transcript_22790/g.33989  ORF Transcript_22790/g.33989 Transcript_22790/m.33989 type:complete len:657 (+) Transcript_22790:21-1991(+)